MSNFENISCKVLGIILFILVTILSVQLMGCTSTIPKEKPTIRDYPLLDHRGILHKYRDDFKSIVFPTHNEKLTQYCGTHFQWESVTAMWKSGGDNIGHREEADYHRWIYIVIKTKKQ